MIRLFRACQPRFGKVDRKVLKCLHFDVGTQPKRTRIRGRGISENPRNRFMKEWVEPAYEDGLEPARSVRTQWIEDFSQSIISSNDSPDIGFNRSINPYRGCEHGCAYCFARPTHEYLGYSAGLDFESRILYKPHAAELLISELSRPRYVPEPLALSGVTDPFQPVERRLRITRAVLEVLAETRHPVMVITKNAGVLEELDSLRALSRYGAAGVHLSLTSLDPKLVRRLEPRTSLPAERLQALSVLREVGVPAGALLAPIIPGLNDTELGALVKAAVEAGAQWIRWAPVRLPHGVKDILEHWLEEHEPGKRERVLDRIRSMRGGKLNDSRFGHRFRGQGIWAEQLNGLVAAAKRKAGFEDRPVSLSVEAFRKPEGRQMTLF